MHISDLKTIITPDHAKALLAKNIANRKLSEQTYGQYKRDIINGDWQLNGETIKIAEDGELIDGQHRLTACLMANRPIECILVEGLPNTVKQSIDNGKKRTFADRAAMMGIKNGKRKASTVNFLSGLAQNKDRKNSSLTHSEILEVLENHPMIDESVEVAMNCYPRIASWIAALHYVATFQGKGTEANAMVQAWRDGQKTYEDDAVVFCREWLRKDDMKNPRLKASAQYKIDLILNSYNKFIRKLPMTNTKFKEGFNTVSGWDMDTMFPTNSNYREK